MRNVNPADKRVRVASIRVPKPGETDPAENYTAVHYELSEPLLRQRQEAKLPSRRAHIVRHVGQEGWSLGCFLYDDGPNPLKHTAKGLKKAAAVAAAAAWVADEVAP